MYGVAGFHSLDLDCSERPLNGFGTMDTQKLGWRMRGRDMLRACGSEGAKSA